MKKVKSNLLAFSAVVRIPLFIYSSKLFKYKIETLYDYIHCFNLYIFQKTHFETVYVILCNTSTLC